MKKIWIYNIGQWIEKTYEEIGMKGCSEESFEDFLKSNEFNPDRKIHLGNEFEYEAEFYEHTEQKKWYVCLSFYQDFQEIIIENTPSFLIFMNQFKDLFKDNNKSEFIEAEDGICINKNALKIIYEKTQGSHNKLFGEDAEGNEFTLFSTHKDLKQSYSMIYDYKKRELGI